MLSSYEEYDDGYNEGRKKGFLEGGLAFFLLGVNVGMIYTVLVYKYVKN